MERKFWRSEIFEIWVQYVAAGLGAIPGGIIYALSRTQFAFAFQVGISVAVGLGLIAWLAVGHMWERRRASFAPVATSSNVVWYFVGPAPTFAVGSLILAGCFLGAPNQGNLLSAGSIGGAISLPVFIQVQAE
jgi:hypothetical protein